MCSATEEMGSHRRGQCRQDSRGLNRTREVGEDDTMCPRPLAGTEGGRPLRCHPLKWTGLDWGWGTVCLDLEDDEDVGKA